MKHDELCVSEGLHDDHGERIRERDRGIKTDVKC